MAFNISIYVTRLSFSLMLTLAIEMNSTYQTSKSHYKSAVPPRRYGIFEPFLADFDRML